MHSPVSVPGDIGLQWSISLDTFNCPFQPSMTYFNVLRMD